MIPISLYIHMPWCIKKCPYCDFNSHKSPAVLPEEEYISALLHDLDFELTLRPSQSKLQSIFIGGGTPSLFSAYSFERLLSVIAQKIPFEKNIEITLEANPGAIDHMHFKDYRTVGINRLSLGIQSFNAVHLKKLGRVHDQNDAIKAIETARKAGFDNINLDLMHGLPAQTAKEALDDLQTALSFSPEHLSWYQLTIEPNTVFYSKSPTLPTEHVLNEIEIAGFSYLKAHEMTHYEISAFCKAGYASKHNLNYWLFGDYYGIGAGAHGKWTDADLQIVRTQKHRMPKDYMQHTPSQYTETKTVSPSDIPLEFILNTSRLNQPIPFTLYTERGEKDAADFLKTLELAKQKGLVTFQDKYWQVTPLGRRFTNDLQGLFLKDEA